MEELIKKFVNRRGYICPEVRVTLDGWVTITGYRQTSHPQWWVTQVTETVAPWQIEQFVEQHALDGRALLDRRSVN